MTSSPVRSKRDPAVLVFDGDCRVCTWAAGWLIGRLRRTALLTPWQQAPLDTLGLSEEEAAATAWWIDEDGRHEGHVAVARVLMACGGGLALLGRLMLTPPFSWAAKAGYALFTRNRGAFPGRTPALERPDLWPLVLR